MRKLFIIFILMLPMLVFSQAKDAFTVCIVNDIVKANGGEILEGNSNTITIKLPYTSNFGKVRDNLSSILFSYKGIICEKQWGQYEDITDCYYTVYKLHDMKLKVTFTYFVVDVYTKYFVIFIE